MNINDAFPSNYLKSSDLQGEAVRVKIKDAVMEQLGDDNKLILHFAGKQKGMVCNRTNSMTIAEAFGPETDNWIGAEIELFSTKVPFQGKLTDALRVRIPKQKPVTTVPNARARAMAAQAAEDLGDNPPADDLEDSVPF